MWSTALFYCGLIYWAWQDARHGSVPAWPFESWCVLVYGLQLSHGALWWPPLLWGSGFAAITCWGKLGAADAWLIMVLACRFASLPLLWLLLLSCVTGILHALGTHHRRIPWLPHLALAAIIIAPWT